MRIAFIIILITNLRQIPKVMPIIPYIYNIHNQELEIIRSMSPVQSLANAN